MEPETEYLPFSFPFLLTIPLYRTTQQPQFVPETVLKRRNRDVKTAEQRALNRKHKVSTSRNKQDEPIKRVEKYVKEYKQGQKSFVDIKRRVISFSLSPFY